MLSQHFANKLIMNATCWMQQMFEKEEMEFCGTDFLSITFENFNHRTIYCILEGRNSLNFLCQVKICKSNTVCGLQILKTTDLKRFHSTYLPVIKVNNDLKTWLVMMYLVYSSLLHLGDWNQFPYFVTPSWTMQI